jgi:hypothetical protein
MKVGLSMIRRRPKTPLAGDPLHRDVPPEGGAAGVLRLRR